ncbi:MAG: bifunctional DNA-binding transcriptional regulator/O6-methylguanine-DNA methyltransferase Ada [Chthoniobacterales bacterium]
MTDSRYKTDARRWEALCCNDSRADGYYYYAVKTTGVYCRPSCPSRRPTRKNVEFLDSREAAEKAGYRPCKRCQPEGETPGSEYSRKVAAACRLIESSEETPSLDELARAAAMSKFHFHRIFRQVVGLTPKAYSKAYRAGRMRQGLSRGDSVTKAVYDAGYSSSRQFYEEATRILGMLPKNYREGGKNETICYATGRCSLGIVLVASTAKGICALSLGDDEKALFAELEERFFNAKIISGDKQYGRLVTQVVSLLETSGTNWNLPLDIRGTAFQMRVWRALQGILPGSRISYSELAERMGCPKSVRAVASACAANKLAVAIPCHRVLRSDGSLAGYRWGVKRKRELLEREKAVKRQT